MLHTPKPLPLNRQGCKPALARPKLIQLLGKAVVRETCNRSKTSPMNTQNILDAALYPSRNTIIGRGRLASAIFMRRISLRAPTSASVGILSRLLS